MRHEQALTERRLGDISFGVKSALYLSSTLSWMYYPSQIYLDGLSILSRATRRELSNSKGVGSSAKLTETGLVTLFVTSKSLSTEISQAIMIPLIS